MLSETTFAYLANHLFLPPRLPEKDDYGPGPEGSEASMAHDILAFFMETLTSYKSTFGSAKPHIWDLSIGMVQAMASTRNRDYKLSVDDLSERLRDLSCKDVAVALHIEAQNAGIILQRDTTSSSKITISTFEVSAVSKDVVGCVGALRREFPGTAVNIDRSYFADEKFTTELAKFLIKMDEERIVEALPKSKKSGNDDLIEERDTTHPMFITEMFSGILCGLGKVKPVHGFTKRYRDDVIDGKRHNPWRRSPLLLVIKVALQMLLHDLDAPNLHINYKRFMLYLLSRVVEASVHHRSSNELTFILNCKVARRAEKLGDSLEEDLARELLRKSKFARAYLDANWESLQHPETETSFGTDLHMPTKDHLNLVVSRLRQHLHDTINRSLSKKVAGQIKLPSTPKRLSQDKKIIPETDLLNVSFSSFDFQLADLETWVRTAPDSYWKRPSTESTHVAVSDLLEAYLESAQKAYKKLPEDLSIMVLTAFHIWMVLDQLSIKLCPLISEYNPGFDEDIFEGLLLPHRYQLEQLRKVRSYLKNRRKNSQSSLPSPFHDKLTSKCFLTRYFDSSPSVKELKEQIERRAKQLQQEKLEEYRTKKKEYDTLMAEAHTLNTCDTYYNYHHECYRHSHSCRKCDKENRARYITLQEYEWPLPDDEDAAKAVVAEISLPAFVSRWRDITYALLVNPFSRSKPEDIESLQDIHLARGYSSLQEYITARHSQIHLGSIPKSFMQTHYSKWDCVSMFNETNIFQPNGLRYRQYDSNWSVWTKEELRMDKSVARAHFATELESNSYKSLKFSTNSTSHTSNWVLSNQSNCHRDINLHEFYSYGTLRAGHKLQWRNIAKELHTQTMNFNAVDVHNLVLQAAWQVETHDSGRSQSWIPDSHIDLLESGFCTELLTTLNTAIESIKTNWRSVTAMRTYILLTQRILSLLPDSQQENVEYAQQLLLNTRKYTIAWMQDLLDRLTISRSSDDRQQISLSVLEVAANGLQTYNMERLEQLTEEEISDAIELAIKMRMHSPPSMSGLSKSLRVLIRRCHRMLHSMEPVLRGFVSSGNDSCISAGVRRIYHAFQLQGSWEVSTKSSSWITSVNRVVDAAGEIEAHVALNLLDGRLLVDGCPISRLPEAYEKHEDFQRLFGDRILDVVASSILGMSFMTSYPHCGHVIHFEMRGSEMTIRTVHEGYEYLYISHSQLFGEVPRHFSNAYAHWLRLESSDKTTIELRSLESPWKVGCFKWLLVLDLERQLCRMISTSPSGYQELLENRSLCGMAVCDVLSPIERPEYIHVLILDENFSTASIELPRLGLEFILQNGRLSCKSFRNMKVDSSQSFGTFTGLSNKLALCNDEERCVIVPHGSIKYQKSNHHVSVSISTGDSKCVQYSVFTIDDQLGRLKTSGRMSCQILKAYLHALTSHCLPDQLTGRTGTEEALLDLRSGRMRSFEKLSLHDVEALEMVAKLTPSRGYYPKHLKVTEVVQWDDALPALSQHEDFAPLVKEVFEQCERLQVFLDKSQVVKIPKLDYDHHLGERAAVRNRVYYVDLASTYPRAQQQKCTVNYAARDRSTSTVLERRDRVASVAKLVDVWSSSLNVTSNLLTKLDAYKPTIPGAESGSANILFELSLLGDVKEWFPQRFSSLKSGLADTSRDDKFRLLYFFSGMAYARNADMEIVHTLLAFAIDSRFHEPSHITPPSGIFRLQDGYEAVSEHLWQRIYQHALEFDRNSIEWGMARRSGETDSDYSSRRKGEFTTTKFSKSWQLASKLAERWPGLPNRIDEDDYSLRYYFDLSKITDSTTGLLKSWNRNRNFKIYVEQLQRVLDDIPKHAEGLQTSDTSQEYSSGMTRQRNITSISDLLERQNLHEEILHQDDSGIFLQGNRKQPAEARQPAANTFAELDVLLNKIKANSRSPHELRFINDLFSSSRVLQEIGTETCDIGLPGDAEFGSSSSNFRARCKEQFDTLKEQIFARLSPTKTLDHILSSSGLWPRTSDGIVLSRLRKAHYESMTQLWRSNIVRFGLSLSKLQQATRIERIAKRHSEQNDLSRELVKELASLQEGHSNWIPSERPEWLLFELENDIIIRPNQIDIAEAMMNPEGNSNSVMQLNMGEGKSSVIVPIIASALADGTHLARVFVLKALSSQMFHLLATKLGGLLNRRIFYLPFSRQIILDEVKVRMIEELFQECVRSNGILLVQPEHVLSFELMGYERILTSNAAVGRSMTQIQAWLDSHCRDILDESDEILGVKYELIYTIGLQEDIDYAPERWKVLTSILSIVKEQIPNVQKKFPEDVELIGIDEKGIFPRTRLLSSNASNELIRLVVDAICNASIESAMSRLSPETIREYITSKNTRDTLESSLKKRIGDSEKIWKLLLLLRGVIAGGVLEFTLREKRWRVNYGLDNSRTMLAVPYRAKDSPAARAEFSHPDVIIILTALSYYYGGLTKAQLYVTFETMLGLEAREDEYRRWLKDSAPGLDPKFYPSESINLRNKSECYDEIFPYFVKSKAVIDFYLCQVVYPKEVKQFHSKLSTSGWDIAKQKRLPTTGFSGTNDSRYLLPLSIKQCDNPAQLHTNALVLNCILGPENTYVDINWDNSFTSRELIQRIPEIVRVLIDVGAQILDFKNEEVAKYWLESTSNHSNRPQAVVYFSEENDLLVYNRSGQHEPLIISPFAKQLDQCLIYLDEVHTRGTDLVLPTDYKAMVTLGPALTKDRLAQACMRMRKLGKGQSLVFVAPPEVQQTIRETAKLSNNPISVRDILQWAVFETCKNARKSVALWYTQGARHQTQRCVHQRISIGDSVYNHEAVKQLLDREARTLKERYGGKMDEFAVDETNFYPEQRENMQLIRNKVDEVGKPEEGESGMQEEQERELSPEAEKEVELERPLKMEVRPHEISKGLLKFIQTGYLLASQFQKAASVFNRTTAVQYYPRLTGSSKAGDDIVLATSDFIETLPSSYSTPDAVKRNPTNSFLRPATWILTSTKHPEQALLISPFEANALVNEIRKSEFVNLHVYSPSVSRTISALDKLTHFNFNTQLDPPSADDGLIMQLNLFAGQVYFDSYEDYIKVCRYLGIAPRIIVGVEPSLDGFINPADRATTNSNGFNCVSCVFDTTPVPFFAAVLAIRRKGNSVEGTHMGKLLSGVILQPKEFEDGDFGEGDWSDAQVEDIGAKLEELSLQAEDTGMDMEEVDGKSVKSEDDSTYVVV